MEVEHLPQKPKLVLPEDPLRGVPPGVRVVEKKWGTISREVDPTLMGCMWAEQDPELAAVLRNGMWWKKGKYPTDLAGELSPLLKTPFE